MGDEYAKGGILIGEKRYRIGEYVCDYRVPYGKLVRYGPNRASKNSTTITVSLSGAAQF
jgi:hypothetical protein